MLEEKNIFNFFFFGGKEEGEDTLGYNILYTIRTTLTVYNLLL